MSVNKPTDLKTREADVNRKLQVYGVASAFQVGKVPSNDQIDVALNSFLKSKAISSPSKKLSKEGQAITADFRDVVEQAKQLLLSKNDGNLLQDFIYQTQQFDPKTVSKPGVPLDKTAAKGHGQDALQGLKTLGTLLITNGQFRKLLKDASVLLRDMAGDAAGKAASSVKPSAEQLAKIDDAAEENTWHKAPDVSKAALKKRTEKVYKGDAKSDLQEISDAATKAGKASGGNAQESGQAGADAGAAVAKKKFADKVPAELKEKARLRSQEYRTRSRDYFNQKMPKERRDQVIFRLKKMVMECQAQPDYRTAIETLLTLAEQYGSHATSMGKDGSQSAKQARSSFEKAEASLRLLIERFANGTSMDGLLDSIKTIHKDADKDPELKDWFRSINKFIRRCLQEQGYVMDDISTKEGHRIYDQGRYLTRDKYRSHTNKVVDEARFLGDQFDKDPTNKAFANSMQKLFTDLGKDESGKAAFKPHLLKDISEVIVPAVLENLDYIPIPRIEYQDPQIDAVIENLVLQSDNFAPNMLEIDSDHSFSWGRKQAKGLGHIRNGVTVAVKGIQMDLRDVSYHIKKKQGFPSITDTGVVDILLPGDGLSFKMKMSSAERSDKQHFFKVDKVDVDVKKLKIKVKKSQHKLLFTIASSLMMRLLQPVIKKVAEKAIKEEFNRMDALLYDVKQTADRARDADRGDENGKKSSAYARYADAFKKKMLEGKEKAAAKAEANKQDKQLKFPMTKEESIFPEIDLPGGISTKATEYKTLARKGDKWESPVFSIGKAEKSRNIPAPPEIRRKEAPSTVRSPSESTTQVDSTQYQASSNKETEGVSVAGRFAQMLSS